MAKKPSSRIAEIEKENCREFVGSVKKSGVDDVELVTKFMDAFFKNNHTNAIIQFLDEQYEDKRD